MLSKLSLMIRKILGAIIMKVLSIPGLKKWFVRLVYLYEKAQLEDECAVFERRDRVARLNFSHYLPNTEERIERLRRVINGRPVAIILHGPSVKELEARITELDGCDICYFGANYFRSPEKYILQKINRTHSVVMVGGIAREDDRVLMQDVIDFLERQEANIFISDRYSMHTLEVTYGVGPDEFIKKYDKKLLFFEGRNYTTSITVGNGVFLPLPSIEHPLHFLAQSSFSFLLSLALIGGAPLVVVFGGDGGRINAPELHYRECGPRVAPESEIEDSLAFETKQFNLTMPVLLEKVSKIYNLAPVDIVNCSLQSNYTPLRKLSYDDTFALLKSFKKVTV